jgi:hypothetical protein
MEKFFFILSLCNFLSPRSLCFLKHTLTHTYTNTHSLKIYVYIYNIYMKFLWYMWSLLECLPLTFLL